jgi:hypothetical protein
MPRRKRELKGEPGDEVAEPSHWRKSLRIKGKRKAEPEVLPPQDTPPAVDPRVEDVLTLEVVNMVKDKENAEKILLNLMRKYSFSFEHLKELLKSKVSWTGS